MFVSVLNPDWLISCLVNHHICIIRITLSSELFCEKGYSWLTNSSLHQNQGGLRVIKSSRQWTSGGAGTKDWRQTELCQLQKAGMQFSGFLFRQSPHPGYKLWSCPWIPKTELKTRVSLGLQPLVSMKLAVGNLPSTCNKCCLSSVISQK